MILRLGAIGADFIADVRLVEDGGEVHACGLPVVGSLAGVEAIDLADHFLDAAKTEFCHDFAHFHGDKGHEVHHVLGLAHEVFAQLGILGGDADRAGVLLADAHHQAAHGNQRRGGESVFLGT